MKKKLFIVTLLVLALIVSMFTGCAEKETGPLRICVDLKYVEETANGTSPEIAMGGFLLALKNAGGPTDIEVEYVPASGAERGMAMDRLRVEIMSGGGPDVFIMNCDSKSALHAEEALFPIAERTLYQAIFLPLDEYMENNTQFAEWDMMSEAVLAAGRNEEGQQIIPLAYTIPVSVYLQSDVDHVPSQEITWVDMLETDDEALAAAAVWTDDTSSYEQGSPFLKERDIMLEFILGKLADYENEELVFTETELQDRYMEIMDLAHQYQKGEFDSVPLHYNDYLGYNFNHGFQYSDINGNSYDALNGISEWDTVSFVPLYSDDGGVTASITSYTAINRNTTRPEDAYFVVDYLLGNSTQRTCDLYNFFLINKNSIPIHDSMMSKEYPVGGPLRWHLSDENFAALSGVRNQITHVRFQGGLEIELDRMCMDCHRAKNEDELEKVIAEYYRKMQQMLRE